MILIPQQIQNSHTRETKGEQKSEWFSHMHAITHTCSTICGLQRSLCPCSEPPTMSLVARPSCLLLIIHPLWPLYLTAAMGRFQPDSHFSLPDINRHPSSLLTRVIATPVLPDKPKYGIKASVKFPLSNWPSRSAHR